MIAALIADLGRQDHRNADGSPRFEVVVVDDGSADGTARVASEALAAAGLTAEGRVMRRDASRPSGKGAALADVSLLGLRGTAMVVLDADARLQTSFLRRAAQRIADGRAAFTARRRMLTPRGGGWARFMSQLQDDEQSIDGAIQLGRWKLGAGSEFRGNGSVITLDALRSAGGWDPGALTEDLELAGRLLAMCGTSVAWDPRLVVWEQPVLAVSALLRQRLRWADGLVRRELRVTPAILASGRVPASRRAFVIAYSAQSLVPLVGVGLLVRWRAPRARHLLAAMASAYALGGLIVGMAPLDEARGERPSGVMAVARVCAVVGFSGIWLMLLPLAWLRAAWTPSRPRFARTRHHADFGDPPEELRAT